MCFTPLPQTEQKDVYAIVDWWQQFTQSRTPSAMLRVLTSVTEYNSPRAIIRKGNFYTGRGDFIEYCESRGQTLILGLIFKPAERVYLTARVRIPIYLTTGIRVPVFLVPILFRRVSISFSVYTSSESGLPHNPNASTRRVMK